MRSTSQLAALSCLLALAPQSASAAPPAAAAATGKTRITWLGHAAFEIVTPGGKVLLVDPWVKNPLNPSKSPIADLKKVDWLLITHGHFDHVGDAVEIAKATGARLVASFELAQNLVRTHGFPAAQMGFDTLGNTGGELTLGDGEVSVWFVPAVHSSGIDPAGSDKSGAPIAYGGSPNGFVIKIKNGPVIYHSGDTAFFKDLELIGETSPPDLALINIGGHFGMEPAMAARAAAAVRARFVVPHHYRTFPVLTQDPKPFFDLLEKSRVAHLDVAPGGTVVFEGSKLSK
jgi:L-ascorbate metabolism protein UlaG (beta-lactamase superfamily)